MGSHPSRIGPYRIEAHLASGATCDVYRAWDELLGRPVALRRLRPEAARAAGARERFRRAARAAAGLDHPAIARLHALVDGGDTDVLVLELIAGESLARRCQDGLDAALAVRLAAEIASGVAAAHALGVAHGGLAPEKVIVTPAGHAKMLGFGSGEEGGDERSDLRSLGALLEAMLAGASGAPATGSWQPATAAAAVLAELAARLAFEEPPPTAATAAALLRRQVTPGAPPASPARATPPGATAQAAAVSFATPAAAAAKDAAPPGAGAAGGYAPHTPWRFLRSPVAVAALAAAALAGVAAWLLPRPPPVLRLAIARPAFAAGGGLGVAVDRLAAGLQTALLHDAAGLDGVDVLPAEEVDPVAAPPRALARAVAAGEVLASRLSCQRETCEVSLSRISGSDGRLLWTQTLEAQVADPYLLAAAVQGYLDKAYAGRGRRAGARPLAVRPRDFERYLALPQGCGSAPEDGRSASRLAEIEALRAGSPGFLEAALLEAALLRRRYAARRDPADLDRALEVLRQGRELAPADPRPLRGEAAAALLARRWERARGAIDALGRLLPGDPDLLIWRARLLAARGDPRRGLELLRAAARSSPSWAHLAILAGVETRLGEGAAAHSHLRQALASLPAAVPPGSPLAWPPGSKAGADAADAAVLARFDSLLLDYACAQQQGGAGGPAPAGDANP
jgi:hypothetical protein